MQEWKRIVAGYRLEVRGQTQNEKCKMQSAKCKMENICAAVLLCCCQKKKGLRIKEKEKSLDGALDREQILNSVGRSRW